jgi:hypothetical protein
MPQDLQTAGIAFAAGHNNHVVGAITGTAYANGIEERDCSYRGVMVAMNNAGCENGIDPVVTFVFD